MMKVRRFFLNFFLGTLLCMCIVKAYCQRNRVLTNRITSNKSIISPRKRLLQSTLISKLAASNGGADHQFGDFNGVAISNSRIVVGARGYNNFQGAAYVFMDPNDPESGRSYSQMAILLASDGLAGDYFGTSVDIDGDIIVVGAQVDSSGSGAVYVFWILDGNNTISQMAKITVQNGVAGDYFGASVAVHGNFISVGAHGVDTNGVSNIGSAYLFVNPSNDPGNPTWTQLMHFQPSDLTEDDKFGWSVAMDDSIAVIGTYDLDANAAYVFVPVDENVNSLSSWTQQAKLTGQIDSSFGISVAVANNWIVVGASLDDDTNENNTGAVFVFNNVGDTTSSLSSSWTETAKLETADGAAGDAFGISVSISNDASTIVVGANLYDYNSTIIDSGAAYLFQNSNTTTTAGWTQVGKYVAADQDTGDFLGHSIAIEDSIVVVGAYGDDTAGGTSAGSIYVLNTENSFSAPIDTTAPAADPTFQPTPSPITNQTNPSTTNSPTTMAPTTNNGDKDNTTNNPSSPTTTSIPTTEVPTVATQTPPNSNSTSSPRDSPSNETTTKADNNNVIIAAMVVLGVVVVALGLGFFNYRIRLKREDQRQLEQQQQQQQIMPPLLSPPFSGNDRMAAATADETPVMANVIELPPVHPTEDRTMPADVFLDPSLTHASPPTAAVGKKDDIDAEKGLPEFKDQTRSVTMP